MLVPSGRRVIRNPLRIAIMLLIFLCIASTPLFSKENVEQSDDYKSGYADGMKNAKGKGVWILSGVLLGPIGLILPWVINPKVPGGNLIGKSDEYVDGYMKGYKGKTRLNNFAFSLVGLPVWSAACASFIKGIQPDPEADQNCNDMSNCIDLYFSNVCTR
jgi:hypothetical protein